MTTRDTYIGGKWCASHGDRRLDVVNPTTGVAIADVPAGSPADVDAAVEAAVAAFPAWSTTEPAERARLIGAVADELERRLDEITDIIVSEVGTPRRVARWAQAGFGVMDLRNAVEGLAHIEWEEQLGTSVLVREAIGVVGCITPWNYPLHQITAKVGAALAAGCTVVVKPSEVAPLTAIALTEAIDRAGIPPGVFNLVNGVGPIVGEAIAAHPKIDMVSFTGSGAVGKKVAAIASATVKRVSLELGGKSASVILDDSDLPAAVKGTMRSSYMNGGQSCNALTRMLVPRERLGDAEDLARAVAEGYTAGDPMDDRTKLGPIVSETQRERVVSYIRKGIDEGARLVAGGVEPPLGVPVDGFFVAPTVFSDVDPAMTIAQEEIFGPVLSIIPYDDVDEAVAIANGTVYGIAGAVWSGDADRARSVARRLRAGPGRGERRSVQPERTVRRLQAVGSRSRGRPLRDRGVPRAEELAAVSPTAVRDAGGDRGRKVLRWSSSC